MQLKKELIDQSIDFMMEHLDENLSARDVATHFHFSEFYFSRSFKAVTGKSVYEFLMRLKMDQSAVDIKLAKRRRLTEIGLDYGYSASNFSTAFRNFHHISPAGFRKLADTAASENPFTPCKDVKFETFRAYSNRIRIRNLRDFSVVYERFVGNYVSLKEQWPAFLQKYEGVIAPDALFVERFYDDPTVAKPDDCIYDICVTVNNACALENQTVIRGGKYAVYPYEGAIQDIFNTIQGVFLVWLPQSGFTMEKRFGLNIYPEIREKSDMVAFELCIPIQ